MAGALPDPRQEMFAQFRAAGKGVIEAYALAGYRNKGQTLPYRTNQLPKVRARIRELQQGYAADHGVTVGSILAELEAARENAKAMGNTAAEVAAVMGKAKVCGFLVDKVDDVSQRKPALIPTNKVEMTEQQWQEMVGLRATNGTGNGKAH